MLSLSLDIRSLMACHWSGTSGSISIVGRSRSKLPVPWLLKLSHHADGTSLPHVSMKSLRHPALRAGWLLLQAPWMSSNIGAELSFIPQTDHNLIDGWFNSNSINDSTLVSVQPHLNSLLSFKPESWARNYPHTRREGERLYYSQNQSFQVA